MSEGGAAISKEPPLPTDKHVGREPWTSTHLTIYLWHVQGQFSHHYDAAKACLWPRVENLREVLAPTASLFRDGTWGAWKQTMNLSSVVLLLGAKKGEERGNDLRSPEGDALLCLIAAVRTLASHLVAWSAGPSLERY